ADSNPACAIGAQRAFEPPVAMNDFRVPSSLQGRLDRVRDAAAQLTLREAVQLSVRLDEARHRLVNLETVTPLVRVLLLGGTGVGKSMLFSALVGREGASPSSDDVRLFTRQPHVAI